MANPKKDATSSKTEMSQVMDLFIHVAEQLGYSTDRHLAELADVGVENVANWRSGAVQEFKPQKLKALKESLAAEILALRERAGLVGGGAEQGLGMLEIEEGASPADLHRQFRDRVSFDYLGHRFLYFEPQGAVAWENLIRTGYEQDLWLAGVDDCATAWLDVHREADGRAKGPIAQALGLDPRGRAKGLDLIALGPGEGGKEVRILRRVLELERNGGQRLGGVTYVPIDVSIPLLLTAARSARVAMGETERSGGGSSYGVLPYCADFEEGRLAFVHRLPSSLRPASNVLRLIVMLGNTFGNLRDEESFVRQKLWTLARPGDLVWLEVGLRQEQIQSDPLYRMTMPEREETAAEASRRLLLEGPYRRWEAATGRRGSEIEMRVWVREDDDSSRIPGSFNFCHDLMLKDERRVCTMLYSRRYDLQPLLGWLEARKLEPLRIQRVEDQKRRSRVAHLLLRRT